MKKNQIFALVLRSMGLETKFKKAGDLYRTYNGSVVYNTAKDMIAKITPQTTYNGYEYSKEYSYEQFSVSVSNGSIALARVGGAA